MSNPDPWNTDAQDCLGCVGTLVAGQRGVQRVGQSMLAQVARAYENIKTGSPLFVGVPYIQCSGYGSESGSTCFWPPGSGSTSQRYGSGSGSGFGSGSFYHHAKIIRKTLNPTILWIFLTFCLWKNNVNVPSKSNKQDPNPDPDPLVRGMDPRFRIHTKMSWIRNTAYIL